MENNNVSNNNTQNFNTFVGTIQSGIFFDNDAHKVEQVTSACGNIIEGVNIPETSGEFYEKYEEKFMKQLRERFEDTTFFDYMASKYDGDYIDKLSGIRKTHIDTLLDWMERTKELTRRAAIFDWDRTLTVFEGFPIVQYEGLTYNHILTYLFGGDKRLAAVRRVFQLLNENNIQIIILTNNGACGNPEDEYIRIYFQGMVNKLLNGIPYTLICSRLPPFNGHKGEAIKADSRFTKCATRGGRRKKQRKTKKRRLHK